MAVGRRLRRGPAPRAVPPAAGADGGGSGSQVVVRGAGGGGRAAGAGVEAEAGPVVRREPRLPCLPAGRGRVDAPAAEAAALAVFVFVVVYGGEGSLLLGSWIVNSRQGEIKDQPVLSLLRTLRLTGELIKREPMVCLEPASCMCTYIECVTFRRVIC